MKTLPNKVLLSFFKVDSVDILSTWMPPPSSWSFEVGEVVIVVPFGGGTLSSMFANELFCELSIEDPTQQEGILLEMLPLYCRVELVGQRERAVLYQYLWKKILVGDTVQLLTGVCPIKEITRTPVDKSVINIIRSEIVPLCGNQGLVVAANDQYVGMWIPEIEVTLSLHPNTLCNLSLNTIASLSVPRPLFARFRVDPSDLAIPVKRKFYKDFWALPEGMAGTCRYF